jgi:hypothetical protein
VAAAIDLLARGRDIPSPPAREQSQQVLPELYYYCHERSRVTARPDDDFFFFLKAISRTGERQVKIKVTRQRARILIVRPGLSPPK